MDRLDECFMDVAERIGKLSRSTRSQVGAVLVKDGNILGFGYNGTPTGWDNCCEDENNVTKPEVLHAESNVISKVAKSTNSSEGSTIYCTLSPCFECAKILYQAGVIRVVYKNKYRDLSGIKFLEECNVQVEHIKEK